MRVVHLLRKYDPAEWGGTESAVQGLLDGLRRHNVTPLLYCPKLASGPTREANGENGCRRFKACFPAWGLKRQQRRQLVAVGGNLMSFDLLPMLWRERDVALIHTHTLGRLGGIASAAARCRRVPLVVSIHGGLFALPAGLKKELQGPIRTGWEWGKIFGLLFQSRRLLSRADAVLTGNPEEAEKLRQTHPELRVHVQPHGISVARYQTDQRALAREAFPQVKNRKLILCVGRIDPVKNQQWLIGQAPNIFQKHADALIALVGACTDPAYGLALDEQILELGLAERVLVCGALPSGDPRLIGLYQNARAVVVPSISESFGLVVLEAWAAGSPVISSRTSGARGLIQNGINGGLFSLEQPEQLEHWLDLALANPAGCAHWAAAGRELVQREYDISTIARRVKQLYDELLEAKHALRDPARR